MNSMSLNAESGEQHPMDVSHFEKMQPVDFTLTHEQYLIIQHYLPKRYALIQHKNIKRSTGNSAMKLGMDQGSLPNIEVQNISKLSGNVENTQEIQGRLKRVRTKKIDKYLEQEMPKIVKRTVTEVQPEDELAQCSYILAQLKKHKSAFPFLIPVDPKRDGVLNYFDIIKDPMDLSTVETNLNTGVYTSAAQFHAHINKIWSNSYTYNEKGTMVNKMTLEMEKYHKSLQNNQGIKKSIKIDKTKSKERGDKQKINKNIEAEEKEEPKKSQAPYSFYPFQ